MSVQTSSHQQETLQQGMCKEVVNVIEDSEGASPYDGRRDRSRLESDYVDG